MYWNTKPVGIFPASGYVKIISSQRFKDMIAYLQFSGAIHADQQILNFIDVISNARFSEAMSPWWYTLIIDKSMVKSYDMNLSGKIEIIQKLRPVGNVFKVEHSFYLLIFTQIFTGFIQCV